MIDKTLKFDYCISNPPYQLATNDNIVGQASVKNIFHDFQTNSCLFSENTTMIYPAYRWLQGGGKGLNNFIKFMKDNKELYSIDIFDSFETKQMFNVQIPDGVCITVIKNEHNNNNKILVNNNIINVKDDFYIPTNYNNIRVVEKIKNYMLDNDCKSINSRKLGRSFYGIESDFVEKNPELVFKTNNKTNSLIKVLTNDRSGTGGKPEWFYVDKSTLKTTKYINDFKVITKSAMLNAKDHLKTAELIGVGTAVGRVKVVLGAFKTLCEAKNFLKYLQTDLVQLLFEESSSAGLKNFGKFIPDLVDYSNDNPVFTPNDDLPDNHEYKNLDLDDRLCKYFGFVEEDKDIKNE